MRFCCSGQHGGVTPVISGESCGECDKSVYARILALWYCLRMEKREGQSMTIWQLSTDMTILTAVDRWHVSAVTWRVGSWPRCEEHRLLYSPRCKIRE